MTCAVDRPWRSGDLADDRVVEGAAAQRAVALEHDAALAVAVEDRAVEEQRAPLDLVDRRGLAGLLGELVQLVERVVADADVAGQALVAGLDELAATARGRRRRRRASAPATGRRGRCAARRGCGAASRCPLPAFRGGHLVVTKTSSRSTPLSASPAPTSRLVAVDGRGVQVPVARAERRCGRPWSRSRR